MYRLRVARMRNARETTRVVSFSRSYAVIILVNVAKGKEEEEEEEEDEEKEEEREKRIYHRRLFSSSSKDNFNCIQRE